MTTSATPKQISYIRSLFDTVATGPDVEGVTEGVESVHNLLVLAVAASNAPEGTDPGLAWQEASHVIDVLKPLGKKVRDWVRDNTPSTEVRFRKGDNGAWLLFGSAEVVVPGTVVTVTKGRGADAVEEEKLVGDIVSTCGPNVLAEVGKLASKVASTVTPLVEAFHARMDTKVVGVALAPTGPSENDLAFWFIGEKQVYQVLGGHGRTTQSVGVQKGILDRLAAMTDDEVKVAMAEYGLEIGSCGFCGRSLTNKLSRERGIGPVCWAKGGFA